jgi:hypothetical protein
MSEHKDNPGFVTRAECAATMNPLHEDVKMVKNALIGEDMQSGLVKSVKEMIDKLENIKNDQTEKKTQKDKWKWAAISLAFILIGYLVKFGLDKL